MQQPNSHFTTFLGVTFVLHGFDYITEREVRSKLITGGGIDAGKYGNNCTHVIVDKNVYDDPVCVNGRNEGKIVVTRLWVDHSFEIGIPADTSIIMYRPLKDLNGIPGAKGLIMCLTGYQRHFRDDIMTMVKMMGAQFSKPLVANKVTHLICYKFEGEKYELAYRMKTIKLVNHRWLEDCLKEWKLLPEENYNKSGYELEMMEAEAKDSEDDVEDGNLNQLSCKNGTSPENLRMGTPKSSALHKSTLELPKLSHGLTDPDRLLSSVNSKGISSLGKDNRADYEAGYNKVGVHEAAGSDVAGLSSACTVKEFSNLQDTTPKLLKLDTDVSSISRSSDRPVISDSKLSAVSYTRKTPRRSPSSLFSKELSNDSRSPKMQSSKLNSSSFSLHKQGKEFELGSENPQKRSGLIYEEASSGKKQKTDISRFSHKSPVKMNYDAQACVLGSPSINCSQGSGPKSSVVGSSTINNHSHSDAPNSLHNALAVKSSDVKMASVAQNVSSETRSEQMFLEELGEYNLVSNRDSGDTAVKYRKYMDEEAQGAHNTLQVNEVAPPSNKMTETEKSLGGNGNSTYSVKKKSVVKKTLGSRPSLKITANQKGSININKVPTPNDPSLSPPLVEASTEMEKLFDANKWEVSSVAVNIQAADVENITSKKVDSMDEETEPPNENNRFDNVCGDTTELTGISVKQDSNIQKKSKETQRAPEKSSSYVADAKENVAGGQEDTFSCGKGQKKGECARKKRPSGITKKKTVPAVTGKADSKTVLGGEENCSVKNVKEKTLHKNEDNQRPVGQKLHLAEKSASYIRDGAEKSEDEEQKDTFSCEKSQKGEHDKKLPTDKTRIKAVPAVSGKVDSNSILDGKEACDVKNDKEKTLQKDDDDQRPVGPPKRRKLSGKRPKGSSVAEKENQTVNDGDVNVDTDMGDVERNTSKSGGTKGINQDISKTKNSPATVRVVSKNVIPEPVCFIFSGHRLQRKEYQKIVRHLKGKFCRDSHQWSYQATHFITPDPLRRTEKFFAAVASGRWILKTDYLAACGQAGKLLAEEPYEWHATGLSEDGAINLQAPRKWRLLRERTSHGAFYGMRIIVYGECIAPPLETLKRVVKAGDGTILATSPPYTRFLSSGVDYAVVSPGMPRVDLWVQEFLKHEIPCIVADYLVEYVCKPGYSLEKQVLYNTHAWAEKSLSNLVSRAEEVVEDGIPAIPADSDGSSDIACQVCQSCDRGDVMLICGNEDGLIGCGVGMHIDCCDPPLQGIPEEDWFCPKCIEDKTCREPPKKKKKKKGGNSSAKSK